MGRRKCPTCGSKQWHKEPSSGLIACSEGHILQNYRNEKTEVQELGPHAMKKRTIKSRSEKKGRQSTADPKLYHGARGRYHYFLCLQFILRKQIVVLRRLWDLPIEFEITCKDLWTLHLSMLPEPVPDEVYQEKDQQPDYKEEEKEYDKLTEDEGPAKSATGAENEGESEFDSEMEALMRENSDSSSSSSSDDGERESNVQTSDKEKGRRKRKRKGRSSCESPVNTIAVLVVACWMMRIPVMYRDFNVLIERYELPYLDPLRFLPSSMVQHLTKQNVQGLSPSHAPGTLRMHSAASRLCRKLYSEYGIYTPVANGASILWRLTKEMGCTPLIYMMAKRVASERHVPLMLYSKLAPELRRAKESYAVRYVHDSVPAEVQFMSALIVVLKMVYGLDGQPRVPKDAGDVACAVPGKSAFMKFLGEDRLRVEELNEKEMDEYIGFCERVLVGKNQKMDKVLETFFPLVGKEVGEKTEEVKTKPRLYYGGEWEGGLVGGEKYKTWDEAEEEEYLSVLKRASGLLGVTVEYLNGIVRRIDHQR